MCTASEIARSGIFAALLLATSTAGAQYGGYGAPAQPPTGPQIRQQVKRQKIDGEATIVQVAPGVIQVVVEDHPWLIHLERNCQVRVTGNVDIGALKPGQFVRFRSQFDSKGVPTAPLDALEVITPLSPGGVGVFPASPAGKSSKRGQAEGGEYLVVGRVAAIKDRQMVVSVANKSITVQLADDATVKLDVTDYSLAQAGDKAAIQGWYTVPGTGYASRVSIVLSNPVGNGGIATTKGAPPVLPPAGGAK